MSSWIRSVVGALVLVLGGCQWFERIASEQTPPPGESRYVWKVPGLTNKGVPWFDDSTVFYLGFDHELTAVDKSSGEVRWNIRLPVARGNTVGFGGVVHGSTIIVGDEDVFALDKRNGTILWRYEPPGGVDIGRLAPILWNGLVLAGSSNGWVFAADASTGQEVWRQRLSTVAQYLVYTAPVVDGTLYITTVDFDSSPVGAPLGHVGALDAATGQLLWLRPIPHHIDPSGPTATVSPVVSATVVVGSRDGPWYGFDRATGAVRWKKQPLPFPNVSDPALIREVSWLATCGGRVFGGSSTTRVVSIDSETGNEVWLTPPSTASAEPVWCDDEQVYVMRPLGGIEVLDAVTGARRWDFRFPQQDFFFGSASDAAHIYVGGRLGVYALRKD